MNKFKELGLSDKLSKNLEKLDITEPTEIQEKAIPLALKGEDIIGGSATGSGKTLAFSASIIENIKDIPQVQALILTPTRELAEQICYSVRKFAKDFPVNVLSIYGGVDINQQIRKLAVANIVVGTPGRILDHLRRRTLNLDEVKYLVLDEVDRMFEMGFSEDVENIIHECPKERQTFMFSATISADIDYLAQKHSKDAKEVAVESLVDPTKLRQIFYEVPSNLKFSLLVHLLKEEKSEVVMVFCNTRANVDFIADNLKLNGINAQAIHGGLNQNKRKNVLKGFHKGDVNVLVCTDVAARGLDIKDVSHVYNCDIPKTAIDYIHRIGRTAREGKDGIAINIVSDRDFDNFRNVEGAEDINIERVKLPMIPRAKMKIPERKPQGRFGGRDSRSRDSSRGRGSGSRGSSGGSRFGSRGGNSRSGGRSSGGPRKSFSSRGSSRGGSGSSRGGSGGRGFSSRGGSSSRGSSGGKSSSGPRKSFNSRGGSGGGKSFGGRR